MKTEKKCMVPTRPVFRFFLLFKDFPGFLFFFLFFTVCLVCLFVCLFVFSSIFKYLNFQVFSYTGFLQILENLENLEKSTNFIKIREKSDLFYTEGCAHILSFIFKNDFFSCLFSCLFSLCIPYRIRLF